ncbi:type VII secretion target [Amycolatopsis cynarae]|uniref:Type VII secretion target n=1 Tax=Amycolatopsis cynarae TaxID=2995223 RepID=A0ABY7B7W8_9PSEU|nr:type VII secretion target [Amycolatopsis sp. HUAS 11-8]WAL68432.1 type VII secretion target [Amycolatopsis sp. HUAS 11-8]
MAGGFEADPEALAEHESEVREAADKVHQAIDATGAAQAFGDLKAFGIVGQVVAAALQGWISQATDTVKGLGDAGHELADKVKAAHEALSAHEENSKAALTAIGKDIPA